MEKANTLFGGIFGAFVVSCGAMVLLPNGQIGNLNPVAPEWDGSQLSAVNSYPHDVGSPGTELEFAL